MACPGCGYRIQNWSTPEYENPDGDRAQRSRIVRRCLNCNARFARPAHWQATARSCALMLAVLGMLAATGVTADHAWWVNASQAALLGAVFIYAITRPLQRVD